MNGRINLFCSLFPVFLLENDYETQIDLGWGGFRAKTAAAVEHLSPSRSLKEEKRERERERADYRMNLLNQIKLIC